MSWKKIEIGYAAQGHSYVIEGFDVPTNAAVRAVYGAIFTALTKLGEVSDAQKGQAPSTQRVVLTIKVNDGDFNDTSHAFNVCGTQGVDALQDVLIDALRGFRKARDSA